MQPTSFPSLQVLTGVALLAFGGFAAGATFTQTFTSTPGAVVPDNDLSGLADTISISTTMTSVDKVTVSIETAGGWTGDLYAYLFHEGTSVVLLNRIAKTAGTPAGSSASSMTIVLDDAASTDIHDVGAATTAITGTFQPDGRETDPAVTLDTDPRTALFNSFIGIDANGDWTLFDADQAAGGTATFESWTLDLTVVPEPDTFLLLGLAGLLVFHRRRR